MSAESKEAVAWQLFEIVAVAEGKTLRVQNNYTKEWALGTYAECLRVVDDPNGRTAKQASPPSGSR